MDKYLRDISLIAGGKKFKYPDFTIYFRVNFDDDEDANDARIEVYNLSQSSANAIKKSDYLILNAGYDGDIGTIFTGEVDNVDIDRQQADKIATIEATDRELWKEVKVSETWKEGTKASAIINDILGKTGFDIGDLDLPEDKEYKRGKTIDTTAYKAMKELARDCKAKFHYNKGQAFLRDKEEGDDKGVMVDKKHGLVDVPERINDEEDEGWNVTMLLNHNVTTDVKIKVKSKTANGTFRARKGEHICDRDRFYTKVEAVD